MTVPKKSATKRLLIFGLVLVVVFGLGGVLAKSMGWIGIGSTEQKIEASVAKLKVITQTVSASGKLQPEVEVILRPEVSGEITELPVKEGDYVSKGDLLVRIKPDIYQARIDEVNATLLTQKAKMEQAKANLLEATSVYKQNKKLYESDAIAEAKHIKSKTNFKARKANFQAAKYQVQSSKAKLKQAKEELQKTIIRAPRKGTISALSVDLGERVLGNNQAIGTELLRISKMNQMEVQAQINENDIIKVSNGDTANIEVDAYPNQIFNGVVTQIANSAKISEKGTNEQVTNYEVKIRVITPHNLITAGNEPMAQQKSQEMPGEIFTPSFKPGMSTTVDIQTETVRNVVSVPIQAVTVRDFAQDSLGKQEHNISETDTNGVVSEPFIPKEDLRKVVFVVKNGKAYRREVTTGISDKTHIQIVSGLSAGEQTVIGSYRILSKRLSDGDKVIIKDI